MSLKNLNVKSKRELKCGRIMLDFLDENCKILKQENPSVIPLHTHSFDELVIVLGGSAIHIVDDQEYPIIRGNVFVVAGKEKHGYIQTQNLQLINIIYKQEFFEILKKKYANLSGFNTLFVHEPFYRKNHKFKSKLHLNSSQIREISPFINYALSQQENNREGTSAIIQCIVEIIIINICKYFSEVKSSKPKTLLKISEAINYLDQNFNKPISNEMLANITDMPHSSFRYSFKKITGLSPIDYLIKLRIEKSVEIMEKNTDINVTNIAFSTGFDNCSYFTRQFKKIVGVSPIVYLKSQRSLIK
ncbi:helix-turn-helix domain-containing protein [bacterium]|nr:helix-turn-helix domain-containing protein [bacterium]